MGNLTHVMSNRAIASVRAHTIIVLYPRTDETVVLCVRSYM